LPAGTFAYVSNYEWHVELTAKALRERNRFDLMMAHAVLNSSGLLALLELVTQAERDLAIADEALRQADAKAADHGGVTGLREFGRRRS
jgi:hypothetical protein